MRRWVWRVLLAAMAVITLTGSALAAETKGLVWEQVGDTWKITGYTGNDKAVVIPARHEGGLVTEIGSTAFANQGITSVDIPGTIKTIGENAFATCKSLSRVTFHDSREAGETSGNTKIGEGAFVGCEKLTKLNLSDSVGIIGKNAFVGCGMSEVIVLDGTSSIVAGAFSGCTKLTKVAISGDKTPIAVDATAFNSGGNLKAIHCQGTVNFTSPTPDDNPWKGDALHTAVIVNTVVSATCQHAGSVSKSVTCGKTPNLAACKFTGETRQADKLPHDYQPPAGYTPPTGPSCWLWTEEYEEICTKCSAKRTVYKDHPGDGNHNWDAGTVTETPATCIKDGVKTTTKKCQNVGCKVPPQISEEVIPKETAPHTYETTVRELLAPTCLNPGYKAEYRQCKVCGALDPAACSRWDHAKDEACNKALKETGVFDADYKAHLQASHNLQELAALTGSHEWGEWGWGYEIEADKPTCTDEGKETAMRECAVCGTREFKRGETRVVLPLGHDFDVTDSTYKEETKDPTCTEDGKKTTSGFCKREGKPATVEETIPKLGHHYVPLSAEDPGGVLQEATCTEPGKRVSSGEQCTRCFDLKASGEDIEIPPLGHLWGDPVIDESAGDYKAPTCEEAGEGTGTTTCTRTGCHSDPDDKTSPPATQTGKLTLPALGHDWGEWTVTKEATATEAGSRERVCKRESCGKKETREIPPLGAPVDPDNPDKPTDPDNPDKPDKPDKPEETTYNVDVVQASNGTTYVSRSTAKKGDVVTVTVAPDSGYVLDMIRVIGGGTTLVSLTDLGGGQFRFVMPESNVEVRATYDRTGSDYGDDWANGFGNDGSGSRSDPRRTSDVVHGQVQEAAVPAAGVDHTLFLDVPAYHWAAGEINWASEMGYMNGTGGRFNPGGNISRQQMWMVLARLTGNYPASMDEARRWAELHGFADGSSPTAPVKRHQLVTALFRCARLTGRATRNTATLAGYPDSRAVPVVAREPFVWALANGVISSDAEGRLKPNDFVTRDQFAVILYRYCQRI